MGGATGYLMFDETYYNASSKFNYSAGLYVSANLPIHESRLSFRSGYYIETKRYTREYRSGSPTANKSVETSFYYGNIPLLLEAGFNVRRYIYPYVSAGIILGRTLVAEQKNTKNSGEVTEGFPPNSNIKETQTKFFANAGAIFRISDTFKIRSEIFLCQQLDKDEGGNEDRFGYFSYGLKLGLQIDMLMRPKKEK